MKLVLLVIIFLIIEGCVGVGIVPDNRLNKNLQIETTNGIIQGKRSTSIYGKRYHSYMGVPYARPPVGDLRFRAPKPMTNWSYVLDATSDGPCCAGFDGGDQIQFRFTAIGDEDCLYLNVFTSKSPDDFKSPLPIIVYFVGGSYISGCAKQYAPDFIIEHDVILVIPDFRLGAFGFLSTEDENCIGNWAIKDNIAALEWVQSNIHKFGGDKNSVTIFGQSSGGVHVNWLLISKKATGLFHGAVMMSGTSLSPWSYQIEQRNVAFDIGLALGIETNDSKALLAKLRNVSTIELLNAQRLSISLHIITSLTNGLPFSPSIKHNTYPFDLMDKGEFNKVPVILGTASFETAIYVKSMTYLKEIISVYFTASPGSLTRIANNAHNRTFIAKEIFKHFFGTMDFNKISVHAFCKFLDSDLFKRPLRKTAELLAQHVPVRFFQFSYAGQIGYELMRIAAPHPEIQKREFEGVLKKMVAWWKLPGFTLYLQPEVDKLQRNPIPTIDPSLDNVTWPTVTPNTCPYLDIGDRLRMIPESFDEDNFQFWKSIFDRFAKKPYKVY